MKGRQNPRASIGGFLCRFKICVPHTFVANPDVSMPRLAALASGNSLKSRSVVFGDRKIPAILGLRRRSDVSPHVVALIKILMVEIRGWHGAGHPEPSCDMAVEKDAINRELNVSGAILTANNIPNLRRAALDAVRENTRLWIIMQNFAKSRVRDSVVLSHRPSLGLIVRSLDAVASSPRLRHFYHMAEA